MIASKIDVDYLVIHAKNHIKSTDHLIELFFNTRLDALEQLKEKYANPKELAVALCVHHNILPSKIFIEEGLEALRCLSLRARPLIFEASTALASNSINAFHNYVRIQEKTKEQNNHRDFDYSNLLEKELQQMSPTAFEELVRLIYETWGYKAVKTPTTNDDGVDVIAKKENDIVIIQCKRYQFGNKVSKSAIMELNGYKAFPGYSNARAVLITTSECNQYAKDCAYRTGVEIIEGDKFFQIYKGYKAYKQKSAQSQLMNSKRKPRTIKELIENFS